jgi:hypothetical protein
MTPPFPIQEGCCNKLSNQQVAIRHMNLEMFTMLQQEYGFLPYRYFWSSVGLFVCT